MEAGLEALLLEGETLEFGEGEALGCALLGCQYGSELPVVMLCDEVVVDRLSSMAQRVWDGWEDLRRWQCL